MIEKAASLWGRPAQRSLDRSALAEAIEQLTRALAAIAELPSNPALRREQIRLQIALIAPLTHVKGHAAPEIKAAVERARLLIEQAETQGEPPEDPLLLFSVLYGFWVTKLAAFDGNAMCDLGEQFLALAEKQPTTPPLVMGHRIMGFSLVCTGNIVDGRAHLNRAIGLYDPVRERPLATRFASDGKVASLSFRSVALWLLGYADAARADTDLAIPAHGTGLRHPVSAAARTARSAATPAPRIATGKWSIALRPGRLRHLISNSSTAKASFGQCRNRAFSAHMPSRRAS